MGASSPHGEVGDDAGSGVDRWPEALASSPLGRCGGTRASPPALQRAQVEAEGATGAWARRAHTTTLVTAPRAASQPPVQTRSHHPPPHDGSAGRASEGNAWRSRRAMIARSNRQGSGPLKSTAVIASKEKRSDDANCRCLKIVKVEESRKLKSQKLRLAVALVLTWPRVVVRMWAIA